MHKCEHEKKGDVAVNCPEGAAHADDSRSTVQNEDCLGTTSGRPLVDWPERITEPAQHDGSEQFSIWILDSFLI